jgi:hypothetical protein
MKYIDFDGNNFEETIKNSTKDIYIKNVPSYKFHTKSQIICNGKECKNYIFDIITNLKKLSYDSDVSYNSDTNSNTPTDNTNLSCNDNEAYDFGYFNISDNSSKLNNVCYADIIILKNKNNRIKLLSYPREYIEYTIQFFEKFLNLN